MENREIFSRFCAKLAERVKFKQRLHPSSLQARGGSHFAGQDFEDVLGERFDREMAGKLLEDLEKDEKLFPEIAEKHFEVLNEVKSIWKGLL